MMRTAALAMLASMIAVASAGCGGSTQGDASQTSSAPSDAPITATLTTTPLGFRLPAPVQVPEALPPLPADGVVHVNLVLLDRTVQISPDMRYQAWTFNGTVPGPVIHAQVGDTIDVTLTNKGMIGHSIDFHAALAPPDVAYQTVQPGHTLHFSWVAHYPGAFLYHCGTPPVLAHISNGMYGAIVVDPKDGWGPDAQTYVFVQSEFYPSLVPGTTDVYAGDMAKMRSGMPDVVAFNGLAFRYRMNPLPIKVGRLVRAFVVDAGPSHFSAFHVVGTILQRVLVDGNPANVLTGLQTAAIPPGGGAVVEFTVDQAGTYPFVTHSFGDADNGALGLFAATD